MGIFWGILLEILGEIFGEFRQKFFGNSLGILPEFWGEFLGNSARIFGAFLGILLELVGNWELFGNRLGIVGNFL